MIMREIKVNSSQDSVLTLIWVGFLGVCFEVGWRGGKITPFLKLIRIMLETWNLARKYTRIFSFTKNILFST